MAIFEKACMCFFLETGEIFLLTLLEDVEKEEEEDEGDFWVKLYVSNNGLWFVKKSGGKKREMRKFLFFCSLFDSNIGESKILAMKIFLQILIFSDLIPLSGESDNNCRRLWKAFPPHKNPPSIEISMKGWKSNIELERQQQAAPRFIAL